MDAGRLCSLTSLIVRCLRSEAHPRLSGRLQNQLSIRSRYVKLQARKGASEPINDSRQMRQA